MVTGEDKQSRPQGDRGRTYEIDVQVEPSSENNLRGYVHQGERLAHDPSSTYRQEASERRCSFSFRGQEGTRLTTLGRERIADRDQLEKGQKITPCLGR